MHLRSAPVGETPSPRAQQLASWMPEAVVVGASLTVVAMAVGALSAGPATVLVALFASGALWVHMDDDTDVD